MTKQKTPNNQGSGNPTLFERHYFMVDVYGSTYINIPAHTTTCPLDPPSLPPAIAGMDRRPVWPHGQQQDQHVLHKPSNSLANVCKLRLSNLCIIQGCASVSRIRAGGCRSCSTRKSFLMSWPIRILSCQTTRTHWIAVHFRISYIIFMQISCKHDKSANETLLRVLNDQSDNCSHLG